MPESSSLPVAVTTTTTFDAASAKAGIVEPGLDGDDVAFFEEVVGGGDARILVHGEAESVAGAVEETCGTVFVARGLVALRFEVGDNALVDQIAEAGADGAQAELLGGADGGDELALRSLARPPR